MTESISIIGLGKLGASMAAAFAARNFNVIGVDINNKFVEAVNQGKAPVQETGLDRLLSENKERIRATTNHREAILNSDISFVIVPTPSDERGAFSLHHTAQAFKEIGKSLAQKNDYHNVVLTSTVLPGSMRQFLLPILENESGKKAGQDFGLCYSPEFIALGSILNDFLNPDFTLIGELDERCGSQLEEIYARVVQNGAKSARMNFENAELTKISINSFVTTKITFANMLAEICENLPGGNVDVVTAALGMDKRIGEKYLKGATGYGGPCFPRDNVALSFIAKELGVKAGIPQVTDAANRAFAGKIVKKISPLMRENATVGMLGLAYKPFSHITEESQGIALTRELIDLGFRVIAFDSLSEKMQLEELSGQVSIARTVKECLEKADVVFITIPDPVFAALESSDFGNHNFLVVDFWRILDRQLADRPDIKYIGIGLGEDTNDISERLKNVWQDNSGENYQTIAN